MFTVKNGKPLLLTECIDVNSLKVKHLDGADGTFSGELKAAKGTFPEQYLPMVLRLEGSL